MSTHALGESERSGAAPQGPPANGSEAAPKGALADPDPGTGLTVLRNLDLVVLALALPAFLVGGWPLLGYAATTAAWLVQRAIQGVATKRAMATGDRRAVMGVLAGTMLGRIWLVGLAVLGAGLAEREAGVAAGVFAVVLFTVYLGTTLIVRPLEEARR